MVPKPPRLGFSLVATPNKTSLFWTMHWQPGIPPGNTADSYEIYDVLCAPDGRVVAILECFTHSPTVYYCNALTPTGEWRRLGADSNYDTTVTGPSVLPSLRSIAI